MPDQPSNDTLVAALKEAGLLDDPRVEAAFRQVPRHLFLPEFDPEQIYADESVAIKRDADGLVISSSSQPSMMAIMLDQLQLEEGCNVLEIGAGTGYNAAIMQAIVGATGKVTTIELDQDVAQAAQDHLRDAKMSQVMVVQGDGALGYAPRAAYDRVIATVGVWDIPKMWARQVKPDGVLVAPIWLEILQVSAAFRHRPDGTMYSERNQLCGFVMLRGGAAGPEMHVRVGSSALMLASSEANRLDSAALHLLLSYDAEDQRLSMPLSLRDFWKSFIPYLMLYTPEGFVLANYWTTDDQKPYGIEGGGLGLFAQGSACFVPVAGEGAARCFGSSDAFLAVEDALHAWEAAGRPDSSQLRLRLIPATRGAPEITGGKLYRRRDHYLHAWLEGTTG